MKKMLVLALAAFLVLGAVHSAQAIEIILIPEIIELVTGTDTPAPPPPTPEPTPEPLINQLEIPVGELPPNISLPIQTKIPIAGTVPPGGLGTAIIPHVPLPTVATIPTPKPAPAATPAPAAPATPAPAATAAPTKKPAAPASSGNLKGAVSTSFGLYIEDFRPRLTDKWYMFTPIDVGADTTLTYPLVAENAWIIGSVTIRIAGGNIVVEPQVTAGVTVQQEFMAIVGNLDGLPTVNPDLLAAQRLPLRTSIPIQATFGEDKKVAMYLHLKVDFSTKTAGITPFDPEQNKLFMQNLVSLVD